MFLVRITICQTAQKGYHVYSVCSGDFLSRPHVPVHVDGLFATCHSCHEIERVV